MPVEHRAMQEVSGLPPTYPTIMANDFEAGPSHINSNVNTVIERIEGVENIVDQNQGDAYREQGVERTEEFENINDQNHGDGYREQGRMPNSNVRIESTMLNNGVHAVPTAHWENWKDDHSILNMEAIDNNVRKLEIYSLGWGFTIRADKKELWKEVKQVLESQELERFMANAAGKQLECGTNNIAPPTSPP
nr:hypothetical protein CFP56_43102 [Quercus suber]